MSAGVNAVRLASPVATRHRPGPISGFCRSRARHLHSSAPPRSTEAVTAHAPLGRPMDNNKPAPMRPKMAGLSILPLSSVLRTFLIMSVSSRPALLKPLTAVLAQTVKHSPPLLFDIDRNPLLRFVLYHTFYTQFCGGWTPQQVSQCAQNLRNTGYRGIVLEYARELLEDTSASSGISGEELERQAVASWCKGIMQSIHMCQEGDGVAFKWSGMGSAAFQRMKASQLPSPLMKQAMESVCDAAAAKGVQLWPAAEPQNAQAACDAWTLDLMRKYNRLQEGHAVLFNTYQCYLKSVPETLSKHLAFAKEHHFTLGIKLVRGAYMHSEPRHLIWDTIEDTHACYDEVCEDLLWRRYGTRIRQQAAQGYPPIDMVIASHNQHSVSTIQRIQQQQTREGQPVVPLCYAQLYGMADEVSYRLLRPDEASQHDVPTAAIYKYVTWGTMKDSLHYLLRRAAENQDAFARTVTTRDAMRGELWRRLAKTIGLR